MGLLDRALNIGESKQFREYEKRVAIIGGFEPELELESDEELRERFDGLRERAREGESLDDLLPETFAVVREVGKRTMGMRHFDVQLIGGMVLHGGNIAEMKTGEGKTLTATLAVVLNALAGKGVHLVTVNDYLARRDAEWMSPIYHGLGPDRRRAAEHAVLRGQARRLRAPTSPTARTPSSASTTCATTWPRRWRRRSSAAIPSASSTRSTTSSSTRRARR